MRLRALKLHAAEACSVGDAGGRKLGFWLQRLSGVKHGPRAAGRRSCLEEHPEPCWAGPGGGLWLMAAVRRVAATAADLAVSLRVDGLLGGPKAVEMQATCAIRASSSPFGLRKGLATSRNGPRVSVSIHGNGLWKAWVARAC